MSKQEKPVKRNARGRFGITSGRNVEVDLGDNDPELFEVLEKELDTSIPGNHTDGTPITWIAAFGIRHKDKVTKALGDYANIKYRVHMDALPAGKRLFVYHDGTTHEITGFETSGGKTRFEYAVGDPPFGFGP